MAVRFDAATDRISYSGSMPDPATAITVTAWVYVSVDTDDAATFFRLWNAGGSTTATCAINSGGTLNPGYFTAGGQAYVPADLTLGAWYRIALTCTGTTGEFYLASDADGPTSKATGTVAGAASPAGITVGGRGPSDASEAFNGRIAHVRVWSSQLTQAAIEAEWASGDPVVTSGLWADWPLETADDLTDHSGNGRHLTAGATAVSTETGPPIQSGTTAELAATLPLPVASFTGQVTNPAQVSAALPLPSVELSGTVANPAEVAAVLPLPVMAVAADVAATAVVAASLPVPVVDLAAQVAATGGLSASVPLPVVEVDADVTVTAEVAAVLPLPTVQITAAVTNPAELAAVLPLPVTRITTAPPITGPLHAAQVVDHPGLTAAGVVDHEGLHAVLT